MITGFLIALKLSDNCSSAVSRNLDIRPFNALQIDETDPYQKLLRDILLKQFPDATDEQRNMFRIQFSVYCNSLYVIEHLPVSQMAAMEERKVFDSIPKGEDIHECRQKRRIKNTVSPADAG